VHCLKVHFKPEHTYDTALEYNSSFLSIVKELSEWKEHHKKLVLAIMLYFHICL